jgi:hypothetical protein
VRGTAISRFARNNNLIHSVFERFKGWKRISDILQLRDMHG